MVLGFSKSVSDTSFVKKLVADNTNIQIVDTLSMGSGELAASGDARRVQWQVKTEDVFRRMLLQGDLGLAESYLDGDWETNDLEGLVQEMINIEAVKRNIGWQAWPLLGGAVLGALAWKVSPRNEPTGSRANVAHHYDISPRLYDQMLGPTMQYTCAYFCRPGMTLDEAQRAKMELVAKKLDLRPGMRVLELGCGYGAMAHYLASEYGVHVTGVTLSEDQVQHAHQHLAHPNVDIRLQDYRSVEGKFDRVYSVGIFEHIGRNCYQTYFDKCHELLDDDGIMLIHTIGFSKNEPWNHGGFMNTYIFPGAELPHQYHMSQQFADRWHLEDWHSFGQSYAKTLRCWKENLREWQGLDEFDERFRRMWEYYLMCSAASFAKRRTKLWQIVYTKLGNSRPDDCHHIREVAVAAA